MAMRHSTVIVARPGTQSMRQIGFLMRAASSKIGVECIKRLRCSDAKCDPGVSLENPVLVEHEKLPGSSVCTCRHRIVAAFLPGAWVQSNAEQGPRRKSSSLPAFSQMQ